jgi:predicted DNA-binding protein (MmcQ/YjbR family)
VALWLAAPPGAQDAHVRAAPEHFFEKVAPAEFRARIGKTPTLQAPTRALSPSDVDPLKAPRALALLTRFRKLCLAYPDVSEAVQFGHPVWKAGKKTFAIMRPDRGITLCFWVGVAQQGLLTADPRYRVPAYFGHNGWIALDATTSCDWDEVAALTRQSYRHFALKRMLSQLPPEG